MGTNNIYLIKAHPMLSECIHMYYSMACIRRVSLIVNCGYAHVSIYQNSNPDRMGQHARQEIDVSKRKIDFRGQFSTYSFPDNYFEVSGKDKTTQFERDCNKILDSFKLKFLAGGRGDREKYLDTFSIARWHELPVAERKEHSLSNCIRCFVTASSHKFTRVNAQKLWL